MGQAGQRRVVGHDDRRVGDGLRVEDAGRGERERGLDRGEIGHVDEVDPDAEPAEDVEQLGPGGSIRCLGRDDPVAGGQQRPERAVDRAHPRGEGEGGLGALQLGDRRSERRDGRVVEPAV